MRASTAFVMILMWIGSAGAAPINPLQSSVSIQIVADAGNGPVYAEFFDHNFDDDFGPLHVAGSVTAENGAAHVTTSSSVSASFDDAMRGQVSFVRNGWETSEVESGLAYHLTYWQYAFESDFFGYFHVQGTGNWEGSGTYPLYLQGFVISPFGVGSDGEQSLCMCFGDDSVDQRPHPFIAVDGAITIRAGRTYNFAIYNADRTGGGVPRPLGARSAFSNGDFNWWIEIVRVPEPGTLALLGLGLLGLGLTRRSL